MQNISIFSTNLGWIGVAGTNEVIQHIWIGSQSEQDLADRITAQYDHPGDLHVSDWCPPLRERLLAYAEGEPVTFTEFQLDTKSYTRFQQRVLETTRAIPYGTTLSYQQLANRAGSPRAYRAVGNIMAQNRWPILIPCHRVVGSQGELRGFSAPTGVELKKHLLTLEKANRMESQLVLELSS